MESQERPTARPTIRDVAEAAGVSPATVSNVVNNHPHVRGRTKAKVLDAIAQLGYRPSRAAKSLPSGRTFLVAYCLPSDMALNFALDLFLHQVVSSAAEADLETLLITQRGSDAVQPYADLLRHGGADGFVLSGIDYGDPRISFLRERDIPFACFGRVDDPDIASVDVDGAAGIAAAVDHLCDLGHERIAFMGWPEGSATGDDRYGGFARRLADVDLAPAAVLRTLDDFDLGRKLVAPLMADHRPTAVVAVSDTLALGAMAGLREVGLVPGRDVAVTGFDDVPAASLAVPGLTSLRQPMERVGALLVERLVAQMTGERAPAHALIEPDLIIRDSTTGTVVPDPGTQPSPEMEEHQ